MTEQKKLNERVLEDDYPVHPAYLYVIDGQVTRCHFFEKRTAKELKDYYKAKEITSCDIGGRNLWEQAV